MEVQTVLFPIVSPCPQYKSNYLKHFYANQKDFEKIKKLIEQSIYYMQQKHPNNIDYCFIDVSCIFIIKYLNEYHMNMIRINCYWDVHTSDHVIEAYNFYNDSPYSYELLEIIKSTVLGNYDSSSKSRYKILKPLPKFKLLTPEIDIDNLTKIEKNSYITKENFLKIIKNFSTLIKDKSEESIMSRIECAISICYTLANYDTCLLSLDEFKKYINEYINALLQDDYYDVIERAIYTFSMLASLDIFREEMIKNVSLNVVIDIILEIPELNIAFMSNNMYRRACIGLKELATVDKKIIRDLFEARGISSVEDLNIRCSYIPTQFLEGLYIVFSNKI